VSRAEGKHTYLVKGILESEDRGVQRQTLREPEVEKGENKGRGRRAGFCAKEKGRPRKLTYQREASGRRYGKKRERTRWIRYWRRQESLGKRERSRGRPSNGGGERTKGVTGRECNIPRRLKRSWSSELSFTTGGGVEGGEKRTLLPFDRKRKGEGHRLMGIGKKGVPL